MKTHATLIDQSIRQIMDECQDNAFQFVLGNPCCIDRVRAFVAAALSLRIGERISTAAPEIAPGDGPFAGQGDGVQLP